MCGICGALVLHPEEAPPGLENRVRAMLVAMEHRGPRGSTICTRPNLVMAANRLAIRSVDGHRPPLTETAQGVLTACNGEIDNYRELRQELEAQGQGTPDGSDVSVIGPLYQERGLDFPSALRGVFAIALWDPGRKRLILARDRAGERHLHYKLADGVIYFASEIAALMQVSGAGSETCVEALSGYLLSGYCSAPADPMTSYHRVRPGELIVIDAAGVHHSQYWQVPLGKTIKTPPSRRTFDGIFRAAVRLQTDVDVDYGVMLSGGIDSALITAVTRSVRPERPLKAYCARFAESSFDEGRHAAEVARMLGCQFVPVTVAPEDFPVMLRQLIKATGELLADPAWIPHALVSRRAARDVPMLLGGEGADELFGGYPTYLGAGLAPHYERLPKPVRHLLSHLMDMLPVSDRNMTVSFLLKRFVRSEGLDGLVRHRLWVAHVAPDIIKRLGVSLPTDTYAGNPGLDVMDAVQRHDFTHSLPEALLVKADRGSMCYGVEVRAPFLDREVIEFAAALPQNARVHGFVTKAFLKRYARHYLPRSVVNRRKRGLSVPLGPWLRGPLLEWARSQLSAQALWNAGIDNATALQLLSEHASHRQDHAKAIWTLVTLSEWLQWRERVVERPGFDEDRQPITGDETAARYQKPMNHVA